MHITEYQYEAGKTAIYGAGMQVMYPALGLCGEAGEIANKVKKIYRDQGGKVSEDNKKELSKEIGDVLWYLAALSTDLNLSLSDIAKENINKLIGRQQRGTIQGSGDNR